MNNRQILMGASVMALATAFASSAAAADASQAAVVTADAGTAAAVSAAAAPTAAVAEITVTAQRRVEKAQNVPVEVHAFTGAQIQQSPQVLNVNDVATLIPNAQAGDSGSNQPRWFVRGLGTNRTDFNTVNPIGIYYDDVYISNTYAQEAPLYDLGRVEADIGPQGTLWGKNANAGAINFISATPTFTPDGYVKVGYGSFDHNQEQAAYGGPINDKLAFRAAVYNDDYESWQNLASTGRSVGDTSTIAGRFLLDYVPSDKLDVLLNVHAYRRDGVDNGWNVYDDPDLPVTSKTYKTFYPGGYLVTPYGVVNYVQETPYRTDGLGGNAKVTAQLGDLTLTSITGGESLSQYSGAGSQVPYPATSPVFGEVSSTTATNNSEYEFSEELRLANPGNERLTWQTGAFAYYERVDQNAISYTPANLLNTSGSQALGTTAANTYAEWSDTLAHQTKDSIAGFANAAYNITSRFKVQVGLRWTDDYVSYGTSYYALGNTAPNNLQILNAGVLNNSGAPLLYNGAAHHNFQALTYDVKPQYRITDNVLAYFSFAHAVEAGGYTTATDTGLAPAAYGPMGSPYSYAAPSLLLPEELDAYEIGLKTQWFEHRLTLNVSAFDYQINNAVTNVTTPVVNLTVPSGVSLGVVFRNAGKAYSRGGEIELDAVPVENWRLGISAGYDATRYTSQDSPTYNLIGTQFPRAPKWNVQATTSYDLVLSPNLGALRLAADVNWRSSFWLYPNTCYQFGTGCSTGSAGPDYSFRENGYAVLNLHFTWFPRDDHKLAFTVDILNATDTQYYTHVLAGSTTGTITRLYAPPISGFGSITYRF